MTMRLDDIDAEKLVLWLIANTFNVPSREVTLLTRPGEVDGWDSLGHSVLLTRLTRRLGVPLDEHLAAPIETAGELVERATAVVESRVNG